MDHPGAHAPTPDLASRPPGSPYSWHYWRTPVFFGAGFCTLQLIAAAARFGFGNLHGASGPPLIWLFAIVSGLVLFFIGGLLAGLLVQRLLRGSSGAWRKFLIGAVVIATPFSVGLSLVGGLLGPPLVLLYGLVPYLILAGLPALARSAWLRVAKPEGTEAG